MSSPPPARKAIVVIKAGNQNISIAKPIALRKNNPNTCKKSLNLYGILLVFFTVVLNIF